MNGAAVNPLWLLMLTNMRQAWRRLMSTGEQNRRVKHSHMFRCGARRLVCKAYLDGRPVAAGNQPNRVDHDCHTVFVMLSRNIRCDGR